MELHHTKHHQAYVNGLIAPEDAYFKTPLTRDQIALQATLKFNGRGKPTCCFLYMSSPFRRRRNRPHQPHIILEGPRPCYGRRWETDGKSKDAIERDSRSVEGFKKRLNGATVGSQGRAGASSGVTPPRRSSRLSPPQIRILFSVSAHHAVFFAVVLSKPTSPSLVSTFGNTCVTISPLILLVVHVLFQAFYLQVCCSVCLAGLCLFASIKTNIKADICPPFSAHL